MAVLSSPRVQRTWACVFVIAAQLGGACDDPPPDLQAGRLLTLPGDAAGAALIVGDASTAPPSPDAGSPPDLTSDDDASSTSEADANSADGAAGP